MQLLFVLLLEEMQFWLKQYGVGSDGRRRRLLVVQRVAEQRRRLTAADARRRVAAYRRHLVSGCVTGYCQQLVVVIHYET